MAGEAAVAARRGCELAEACFLDRIVPRRPFALESRHRRLAAPDTSGYAAVVKKPLRCLLQFHEWRLITNDEGQQYKTCTRCGAYRDFTPAAGAS